MVVQKEDLDRFLAVLERLRRDSNAKYAFLLDRSGQQIVSVGTIENNDPTSLASLAAGTVAATEGLAQVIGEGAFSTIYHEGERDSVHISVVADKVILLVVFDLKSSVGLVRLRVKQCEGELGAVVEGMLERSRSGPAGAGVAAAGLDDISDEDIDALFG